MGHTYILGILLQLCLGISVALVSPGVRRNPKAIDPPVIAPDFGPCLSHYTGTTGRAIYPLPRDCRQALLIGGGNDGVYIIFPMKVAECTPIMVYCDQGAEGGGWTLIQRRMDGRLDFLRTWDEYKNGFGSLHGEHWLGLDNIHHLTMQDEYEIYFKMYNANLDKGIAQYFRFFVGPEVSNYTLAIDEWHPSGNAGDSMIGHNGLQFTTIDRDNDRWVGNCAVEYTGAWWYDGCHTANLNGKYYRQRPYPFAKGVVWQTWTGFRDSLVYTEMKIRPRYL